MDRAGLPRRPARATLREWKRQRSAFGAGCGGSSSSRRRCASTSKRRSRTTTQRRPAGSSRGSNSRTRSGGTSSNCSTHGNVHSSAGPVAQLVEQGTFNPEVAGSSPARPIRFRCSAGISQRYVVCLGTVCKRARKIGFSSARLAPVPCRSLQLVPWDFVSPCTGATESQRAAGRPATRAEVHGPGTLS
jgi:hypothetical protein